MGIDMSKMRQRQDALNNAGKKNNNFWKPQEGEQTIRLVCPSDGDPFKDYFFHYLDNVPGFLSPKRNFGEDCPLDTYVRALWNEGSEESRRMAKKLSAKQRFFAPVVVRGEEDQGVRVWGFGKRAYETLVGLVMNPEYGDITDPESGTDLVVTYTKPAGASFPETKITPRRRSSALLKDTAKGAELLESIPDFDELFASSRKTTTEVQDILDNFLNGDTSSGGAEVTTVNAKTSNSVDQAFSELLGG
ncbi:MAG: putative single-stranded DNA-binding protein [Prokaryotic dsDNA virus sp.]|nr:MAG: putative single-stranded DNA-binding protein [Prokaryotic dsDNA virus sp.]|tara:strand:- start:20229 stop:20969 length:741 start_codon:yes stop_codon:yes gene_type:complete